MAEAEQVVQNVQEEDDCDDAESKVAYKPPAEKSIEQILKTDEEDESLRKYKEKLLGQTSELEFWPGEKKNVILRKMKIDIVDHPDRIVELDLEDQSKLKDKKIPLKEGCSYKIQIVFNVQREICSGLKLVNKVSKAILTTKFDYMVGSYAPQKECHVYTTPAEEVPSGIGRRGDYKVKSLFTDDDKNEICSWNWILDVKKEWKD